MTVASQTLSQIGHFLTGDMLFFVITFVLFMILTLYGGRGRMVSLILAYYPATLIYTSIPFLSKLIVLHGDKLIILNKIGIFVLLLVPLSIVLNYYIFSESIHSGAMHLLRSGGFALVGLVLVVMFSYLSLIHI